jgi:hypothetical protein
MWQCSMMETQVQSLLLASPEAPNQSTLNVTKNWLRMRTTTFSDSVKRVKTKVLQGVRSIRSYFWTAPVSTTGTLRYSMRRNRRYLRSDPGLWLSVWVKYYDCACHIGETRMVWKEIGWILVSRAIPKIQHSSIFRRRQDRSCLCQAGGARQRT